MIKAKLSKGALVAYYRGIALARIPVDPAIATRALDALRDRLRHCGITGDDALAWAARRRIAAGAVKEAVKDARKWVVA